MERHSHSSHHSSGHHSDGDGTGTGKNKTEDADTEINFLNGEVIAIPALKTTLK